MLPIRLHRGAFRAVVLGWHRSFYLPSPTISSTASRSSSRVSHFLIRTKMARRSASLTFKSIHLIPFCKRFYLCLTRILSSDFAWKSTGAITKCAKEKRPIYERKMLKDGPLLCWVLSKFYASSKQVLIKLQIKNPPVCLRCTRRGALGFGPIRGFCAAVAAKWRKSRTGRPDRAHRSLQRPEPFKWPYFTQILAGCQAGRNHTEIAR